MRRACLGYAPTCGGRLLGTLFSFRGMHNVWLVIFPVMQDKSVAIALQEADFHKGFDKRIVLPFPITGQGNVLFIHAAQDTVGMVFASVKP